jgi:transposase
MNLDERFADLRCAVDSEIGRARSKAIADLLRIAARVRAASRETEWTAVIEDAERTFAGDAAAVEFLKTLATPPASRAQQFARVRVAEIQLYHAVAMKAGRTSGDVYSALKTQMDGARDAYREKFLTPANGTADYLHAEFVRTLANDDAALLGPEYPGPLV